MAHSDSADSDLFSLADDRTKTMKVIYKYGPLSRYGDVLEVPGKIVHVAIQNDAIMVWAIPGEEFTKVTFVGTGQAFDGEHIATVQQGPFVWHVIAVTGE